MQRFVVLAALLGSLSAQRTRQAEGCPYADPKLTSTEPEEVAWAAYELPLDAGDCPGQIAELRTALRKWCKDDTETGRHAHAHLLRALALRDAVLPADELAVPDDPALRAVATMSLLRVPDNGPLFFAFRQRQPNEAEWEVLGGALALRRHGAFAAELFSSWQPTVRIEVYEAKSPGPVEVAPGFGPLIKAGFPPFLAGWRRDERGILAPALGVGERGLGHSITLTAEECSRARLRWLAYLAAEPDPRTLVSGFQLRLSDRELRNYESRVTRARERAVQASERIGAAFRERRWIPATRKAPAPIVEVVDRRSPAARNAAALPTLDGVTVTVPPPVASAAKAGR